MSAPGPRPLERLIATMILTLAMGLTAALLTVRFALDGASSPVEIAYPESRLLAATAAGAAPDAPAAALRAGVTALMREPYTVDDMVRYGMAEIWHPQPELLQIGLADHQLAGHALMYLSGQLGQTRIGVRLRGEQFLADVRLPRGVAAIDGSRYILEVPYGPMPAGFRRGLRLPAGDWGGGADLDQFTQVLSTLRPDFVMPDWRGGAGADVFMRAYLKTPWLRRPLLVLPETGWPGPGLTVLRRAPSKALIRAYQADEREFALPELRVRQRLVRAVRERGVRLLYLRFPPDWTFPREMAFVQTLKQALAAAQVKTGAGAAAVLVRPGSWVVSVIFFGVGAMVFIFIWRAALWGVGVTGQDAAVDRVLTIRLKPSWFRWAALLTALSLLVLHSEGPAGWGLQAAAWLIAVIVPLLGLSNTPSDPASALSAGGWIRDSLADFARVSAWTLGGAAAIAALLYRPDFLTRLSVFAGVKAAFALPLFFGTVFLFPRITDRAWWAERLAPSRRAATVCGLLGVLAVFGFLLLRSGNHAWLPTWGAELDFRDRLETWLGVRPRFKEFLFGHPWLLLGLAGRRLTAGRGRIWPEVCILVGMVGQLSMLNSFCHAHTPLALTLARTAWGLGLGLMIGLAGMLVMKRGLRAEAGSAPAQGLKH